jgi:hypothetical protein
MAGTDGGASMKIVVVRPKLLEQPSTVIGYGPLITLLGWPLGITRSWIGVECVAAWIGFLPGGYPRPGPWMRPGVSESWAMEVAAQKERAVEDPRRYDRHGGVVVLPLAPAALVTMYDRHSLCAPSMRYRFCRSQRISVT